MNAPALPAPFPAAEGALPLDDWALIRAEGADAAAFLHSQLTQDVEHLEPAAARLAGYCSAKGRLLASFVVWRPLPATVWLACSADLLPATLKRLSMFVLRAKCRLTDAGAERRLYGLAGSGAAAWLGDAAPPAPWRVASIGDAQAIRLPDACGTSRWLWAAPREAAPPALPALPPATWRWLEVASGVPRVVAATVEQFVPQMVNLELVGGVSFSKGCYPGQEVVARSQYRGTLKRRAYLYATSTPAQAGQEVYADGDASQPAGMVVNAASLDDSNGLALVELKIAAAASALHLGAPGGPPLRPLALPYPLPTETA
jgi:folate-binding protein YgfZ